MLTTANASSDEKTFHDNNYNNNYIEDENILSPKEREKHRETRSERGERGRDPIP